MAVSSGDQRPAAGEQNRFPCHRTSHQPPAAPQPAPSWNLSTSRQHQQLGHTSSSCTSVASRADAGTRTSGAAITSLNWLGQTSNYGAIIGFRSGTMVSARSDCVSTHITTKRPPPRVLLCVEAGAGERLLSCFIMAGGGAGTGARTRLGSAPLLAPWSSHSLGWAGLGWAGLLAMLGCYGGARLGPPGPPRRHPAASSSQSSGDLNVNTSHCAPLIKQ